VRCRGKIGNSGGAEGRWNRLGAEGRYRIGDEQREDKE
jgi:hypothetical protein